MKKLFALLLAAVMMMSMVSFASAESESSMRVAMITDYGDITDQSFNQTTYEACKAFCEAAGLARVFPRQENSRLQEPCCDDPK